jgi:hypothetical protein
LSSLAGFCKVSVWTFPLILHQFCNDNLYFKNWYRLVVVYMLGFVLIFVIMLIEHICDFVYDLHWSIITKLYLHYMECLLESALDLIALFGIIWSWQYSKHFQVWQHLTHYCQMVQRDSSGKLCNGLILWSKGKVSGEDVHRSGFWLPAEHGIFGAIHRIPPHFDYEISRNSVRFRILNSVSTSWPYPDSPLELKI